MLTKTRAIVLHSFKYGESKLIVELLTAQCGRVSCIMNVRTSPKSKLKRQYFSPLFILDAVLDLRRGSGLQRISEARLAFPFTSIPYEPHKSAISMFTAEFLRCATRVDQLDETAFGYIENSIRWLDGCDGHYANFHLVFMMRMARFLGFYPDVGRHEAGSWFDMRACAFCRTAPLHHDKLVPEEADKVDLLLRMNFATMHLFKMTRAERNRMVEVILAFYRIHIPGFPELKSLAVLQELFSGA